MNPLQLLIHDPKGFGIRARQKLMALWCECWSHSSFCVQARMDLDDKSWWHSSEIVSTTGGYFVRGDPVPRKVLPLEAWDTVRRDMIILLLRELVARKI